MPRSRALLLLSASAVGLYGLMLAFLGPTLPAVQRSFGLTTGASGLTLGLFGAGFGLGVIVAGRISDRAGMRLVLRLGFLATGAGLLAAGTAPSYLVWLGAVGLAGAAGGFLVIGANVLVAVLVPDRRAAALNWLNLLFALGALSGPLLVAAFGGTGAWGRPFLLGAVVAAVLGTAAHAVRFPPAAHEREAPSRLPWRTPLFIALLALTPLYTGSEVGFGSWLFPYLRAAGFSPGRGAALVSLFWALLAGGRLLVGALALRIGERALLAAGAALGAGGVIATIGLPGAAKIVGVSVAGLGFAGVFPLTLAIAARSFPAVTGGVFGALLAAGGAGTAIVPPLMGAVAGARGSGTGLAVSAATMVGVLLVAGTVLGRPLRPEPEAAAGGSEAERTRRPVERARG